MKHLIIQPLGTFEQLFDARIQVDDATQTIILDKTKSGDMKLKSFGRNSQPSNIESSKLNVFGTRVLQEKAKQKREFSSLGGMLLSETFECLVRAGHLIPLDLVLPLNPLSPSLNLKHYCAFHQAQDHLVNKCICSCH